MINKVTCIDRINAALPLQIDVHVGPSIFGDLYTFIEKWSAENLGKQYHPISNPDGDWLAGGVWREYSNYRFRNDAALIKFCTVWGGLVRAYEK